MLNLEKVKQQKNKLLKDYFIIVNTASLALFGIDKLISLKSTRIRIPERFLHFTSLIGGSPGSILGMVLFRHKNKKKSFLFLTSIICGVQMGLLYYYLTSNGINLFTTSQDKISNKTENN